MRFITLTFILFFLFSSFSGCVNRKQTHSPIISDSAETVDSLVYYDAVGASAEVDSGVVTTSDMAEPPPPPPPVKGAHRDVLTSKPRGHKSTIKKLERQSTSIISGNDIPKGNILYNIPDTMTYGKVETVYLRITKEKNLEVIQTGPHPERSVIVQNIRVSTLMTAELIDPSPEKQNFVIKAINTTEQDIEEQGYTQWEWTIKPIKSGAHALKLLIKVRTTTGLKDIPVFDKDIYVYSKPGLVVVDFWGKYWQWIISTFLIPIFIFFWKKRSNKKTDS